MNNTKILVHLLENREKQFTINQISKTLNINYRIVHTQIKKLEKENIIRTKRAGNSLLCSLTNNFNEKIFLAEYQRRKKLLKNKTLNHIFKKYEKAKSSRKYLKKEIATLSPLISVVIVTYLKDLCYPNWIIDSASNLIAVAFLTAQFPLL